MKRIPSKCAVSTLLGLCSSREHIRILDFPTSDCSGDWNKAEEVYNGLNDLNSYKYARINAAQVIKVETGMCAHPEGGCAGMLTIMICTRFEQY